MKFSEQWLREWVNPPLSRAELAEQLTMAGLEVDAVVPVAAAFSGVVVGHVLKVIPHQQADRLRVCEVDVGGHSPLVIVCGASNVAAGMRVPTAVVGAELPNDLTIKRAKLRGVESHGMLCSARELGLAETAEGLMALPADAPVGEDLRSYLALDDVSFELGLTPNRSDCLGIAGIAREVGVLNRMAVTAPSAEPVAPVTQTTVEIQVEAPAACPRYLGRVIEGVDPSAVTPAWMEERLRRSGLRNIHPIVDVTNYVLLELGQPMHAFDIAHIQGGIRVRHAHTGEAVTLLDGQRLTLSEDMLVIADQEAPLALAGIMGGMDSAVGDETRNIFLESAFFSPQVIAGKAREYGLRTDSSHRFERGVDPELARRAMERATRLLLDIVGGRPGPICEVTSATQLPTRAPIALRASRIDRVLGMKIAAEEVHEILTRLGITLEEGTSQTWQAVPPSFRFDLAIEADLIEEVARIHGYARLPTERPIARLRMSPPPPRAEFLPTARRLLVQRGYQEAITYSFVEERLQCLIDPDDRPMALANPISIETAVMRTSLWPGLLQAMRHNLNRQQSRVRLFESGAQYRKVDGKVVEEPVLAGVVCGNAYPEQWGMDKRSVDFFDLKADVEALLSLAGGAAAYAFLPDSHRALHPGQSAVIHNPAGKIAGRLGLLHPEILRELDVEQNVLVFELILTKLDAGGVPLFRAVSKFPAIRRDLAIIVDDGVPAQAIRGCIDETAGGQLQELQLFDVYRGKGIESGRKSIALGLTLQDNSRTLTDDEIDALVGRILEHLQSKLGASLRE